MMKKAEPEQKTEMTMSFKDKSSIHFQWKKKKKGDKAKYF